MQFYPFTVAVGERFKLETTANFLRYYDCTAGTASPTIKVTSLGREGNEFLLRPGEQIKLPKNKEGFTIENFDAALTISGRILAGVGDFDGAVTLTGSISATTTPAASTTITNTPKAAAVGAVASVIAASATRKSIRFMAHTGNADTIYLGASGVTIDSPVQLAPGEFREETIGAALQWFAFSPTAAQTLLMQEVA